MDGNTSYYLIFKSQKKEKLKKRFKVFYQSFSVALKDRGQPRVWVGRIQDWEDPSGDVEEALAFMALDLSTKI